VVYLVVFKLLVFVSEVVSIFSKILILFFVWERYPISIIGCARPAGCPQSLRLWDTEW